MSTAIVGTKTLTTGNKAYAADLKDLIQKGTTLCTWSYTDWNEEGDYPLSNLGTLWQYHGKPMVLVWRAYGATDYSLYIPQIINFNYESNYDDKYGYQHFIEFKSFANVSSNVNTFRFIGSIFYLAAGAGTWYWPDHSPGGREDVEGSDMRLISRSAYLVRGTTSSGSLSSISNFSSNSYFCPYKLIDLNMGVAQY